MPISVEKLPDEPIIVATFIAPVNYYEEVPHMFSTILGIRDTLEGISRYYAVFDLSKVRPSFGEIVFSLGEARKTSQQRRADRPVSPHLVGAGDMFEMIASAMSQHQYGGYTAPLHLSLAQTLDVIRSDMRSRQEAAQNI